MRLGFARRGPSTALGTIGSDLAQDALGPYIVDFLCVEAMLVIELDGGQHGDARDATRSTWLVAQGYTILRFWNHEVSSNLDGVGDVIAAYLKKKTLTQPSPAKAGEG